MSVKNEAAKLVAARNEFDSIAAIRAAYGLPATALPGNADYEAAAERYALTDPDAGIGLADVRAYAARRFATDANFRRQMGCRNSDATSAEYQNALEKFVQIELKSRREDAARAAKKNAR